MTPEEFSELHRGSRLTKDGINWVVTDTDTVNGVPPGHVIIIPEGEVQLDATTAARYKLLSP